MKKADNRPYRLKVFSHLKIQADVDEESYWQRPEIFSDDFLTVLRFKKQLINWVIEAILCTDDDIYSIRGKYQYNFQTFINQSIEDGYCKGTVKKCEIYEHLAIFLFPNGFIEGLYGVEELKTPPAPSKEHIFPLWLRKIFLLD